MKKMFIQRRSIPEIEGNLHVETYSEEELITCKDCKYWRKLMLNMDGEGVCRSDKVTNGLVTPPNWYCADNFKRTDDNEIA